MRRSQKQHGGRQDVQVSPGKRLLGSPYPGQAPLTFPGRRPHHMRNLDRSMMKTTTLQEAVLNRATTCMSTASMVPSGGAAARAPAKMATVRRMQ